MRIPVFTLSNAALAVLVAPTLLILQSVSAAHPLPVWAELGVLVLIAAGSVAYLAANAQLNDGPRRLPFSTGSLVLVSGLLFALAVGWLFGLAQVNLFS
jgi:drug/metabolite transporter (DMT)-like permease